ncbi:MAG: biotin--[acetyl-CoA-carboxylase] ligase [Nitrospira sp.]|nr:biotin--[acetyl-CoA-carboxylase] ligase [Nitrospira sp.]
MGEPANGPAASTTDQLDIDRLQTSLRSHSFGRMLRYAPSTHSTNADALTYLQQHAGPPSPHGMAILAECQTVGRGRRGRTWHSPAQGNIYSSVIVVPAQEANRSGPWLSWVPLFSALAVTDCLSSHTGLAVSVKWPNDLLIGEKKLGGILCEQTSTPDKTMAIVIGIGLNINAELDSFPQELKGSTTSLAAEWGRPVDRVIILADLLLRLEQRLDRLFLQGPAGMIDEFTQRCSTLGQSVRVTLEEQGLVQGIAESIGPDGCLCLRLRPNAGSTFSSSLLEIRSGEVVHLRG